MNTCAFGAFSLCFEVLNVFCVTVVRLWLHFCVRSIVLPCGYALDRADVCSFQARIARLRAHVCFFALFNVSHLRCLLAFINRLCRVANHCLIVFMLILSFACFFV